MVEFQLHGFEELKKELEQFSKNIQRRGASVMANKGAEVVRNAAKPNIPRSKYSEYYSYVPEGKGEWSGMTVTGRSKWGGVRAKFSAGHVQKNIFMGKDKRQPRGGSRWRVFFAPQAWFAWFLEYGVASKGLPATRFLKNALERNIPKVLDEMRKALGWFIDEQHFKILRKMGGI